MDVPSKNNSRTNGSNKNLGPLIDVSSADALPVTTISPNAVRNRIGASPSNNVNHGNLSALTGSLVPPRSSPAVPGTVQRSSVNSGSSSSSSAAVKDIKAQSSNVVERHIVRRTYEEQSHTSRQTAVGSRLAAETSPDGSTVGDIASDNFDSLSLQLSPHLNRRGVSSTVPSTPIRLPTSLHPPRDLMNLQPSANQEELSDSALQLQAELKRSLESSNSTFTSLVDLSDPVGKKWKRAMSLPQNDFSRVMCHKAVAKSLAQNIRTALRSSPSTIKETLAPGELQAPTHELVIQEPQVSQQRISQNTSDKLIELSPQVSPAINETQPVNVDNNNSNNSNNSNNNDNTTSNNSNGKSNHGNDSDNDGYEDIWVLRESFVDRLEDTDRQWKARQIIEEETEKRLQMETARRMADHVKYRPQDFATDNSGLASAVGATDRRSSESSNGGDSSGNKQHRWNAGGQDLPMSGRSYLSDAGVAAGGPAAYSRLRDEAGSNRHRGESGRGYKNQANLSGEELSDFSDHEDDIGGGIAGAGGQQPSLLRPFSNLLAGRKGAYSKVPTMNERPHDSPRQYLSSSSSSSHSSHRRHQQHSNQQSAGPENIQYEERRRSSTDRQPGSSNSGEQLGSTECPRDEVPPPVRRHPEDFDTDEETDKLLEKSYQGQRQLQLPELAEHALSDRKPKVSMKEVRLADPEHPSVLLEGVLFRCRYLGSTQLVSDSQPSKAVRMMQANEAVSRIKAPFGEPQPSTEVDLFISFEKIMVLSTNLQDIIMDHALKTISYVADLDEVVVLMARRRQLPDSNPAGLSSSSARGPQIKMLCHVFECEDAHHISDAIGEAFHLAYLSFLRANGIEDPSALPQVDNNSEENVGPQDIFNDDLPRFVDKTHQKDIVISKSRGEALGIVVVESGWGSVIPTVVVANMLPTGPAARSGQLNIGDQLLSVNGISLVGLPMTSCQNYIKAAKSQTAVRITLVRCPPVTEVLIKRPDIKYQLGFSVHNGIICSLLRGGIAERGGVRVGHRIIEINGESVVAVSHDRIVSLLSSSIGEIRMKTMPMSIFRLLTGQDTPNYI